MPVIASMSQEAISLFEIFSPIFGKLAHPVLNLIYWYSFN